MRRALAATTTLTVVLGAALATFPTASGTTSPDDGDLVGEPGRRTLSKALRVLEPKAQAQVTAVEDLGNYRIVSARIGRQTIRIKLPEVRPAPSEQAYVVFPPQWTKLYADGHLVS